VALNLNYGFEGGTSGNAVAAGSGAGGGDNNFDTVTATIPVYSNAQAAHGAQSLLITAAGHIAWTTSIGTPLTLFGRCYLRILAIPTLTTSFCTPNCPTTSFKIQVGTAGKIATQVDAGTLITATTALTTSTWYRVEWKVVTPGVAGTGTVDCSYYLGDSPVAVQTLAQATGSTVSADTSFTSVNYGSANAPGTSVWVDDVNVNDQGFPGPAIAGHKSLLVRLPNMQPPHARFPMSAHR
jgi:hypothetical protein